MRVCVLTAAPSRRCLFSSVYTRRLSNRLRKTTANRKRNEIVARRLNCMLCDDGAWLVGGGRPIEIEYL